MKQFVFELIILATMVFKLGFANAWTSPFARTAATAPALGKKSTALDVLQELNRSDQLASFVNAQGTAIVTGGNSGIGAVTVATLATTGMKVVLCARNVEAAQQAIQDSVPKWCQEQVTIQKLDLADMNSIQQATQDILSKFGTIDVIVNNAGVMALPKRMETTEGLELQFGTNHVGHFMFTRLLLPSLNENGRIVTVASEAHRFANAKDWNPSLDTYSPWGAYGNSKLANILFAKSLQEKLNDCGRDDVLSVSLHPGVIGTSLWRYMPKWVMPFSGLFTDKTIDQGAATNVYCAVASKVTGGAYYNDCQVGTPTAKAEDVVLRNQLWDLTERMIADKGFSIPSSLLANKPAVSASTTA